MPLDGLPSFISLHDWCSRCPEHTLRQLLWLLSSWPPASPPISEQGWGALYREPFSANAHPFPNTGSPPSSPATDCPVLHPHLHLSQEKVAGIGPVLSNPSFVLSHCVGTLKLPPSLPGDPIQSHILETTPPLVLYQHGPRRQEKVKLNFLHVHESHPCP